MAIKKKIACHISISISFIDIVLPQISGDLRFSFSISSILWQLQQNVKSISCVTINISIITKCICISWWLAVLNVSVFKYLVMHDFLFFNHSIELTLYFLTLKIIFYTLHVNILEIKTSIWLSSRDPHIYLDKI